MSWDLIEASKKLISINSVTYESNVEIVEYLCSLFSDLDMEIEKHEGELYHKKQFNLIARKGWTASNAHDALLLSAHLDTVSSGDYSLWDKTNGNPFQATLVDDKIYGLGSADVKLDFLCKMKALEKFKGVAFKQPCVLVGTYGEESGLKGAKQCIADHKISAKYAVVGEPSNLNIVYAHKGHLVLEVALTDTDANEVHFKEKISRIDFFGKSAHSSTPHLGENAIQKGFQFLKQYKDKLSFISFEGGRLVNMVPDRACLWFKADERLLPQDPGAQLAVEKKDEKKIVFSPAFLNCLEDIHGVFKKMTHEWKRQPMEEFDPPYSLLSIGVISTQENMVRVEVGIRTLPSVDSNLLVTTLQNQCDKILTKYPTIKGRIEVLRESLPMRTELNSVLVTEAKTILRKMGLQDMVVTKATSTEGSLYKQMGAETIVWGPGLSVNNAHQPNEFNYVHHLEHAVRFYENLIDCFCVQRVR